MPRAASSGVKDAAGRPPLSPYGAQDAGPVQGGGGGAAGTPGGATKDAQQRRAGGWVIGPPRPVSDGVSVTADGSMRHEVTGGGAAAPARPSERRRWLTLTPCRARR